MGVIFRDKMDFMYRRVLVVVAIILIGKPGTGQEIGERLAKAFQQFQNDSQAKHALVSLYVIDGSTGNVVFDRNADIGMAPASTQKIITSTAAYELLGRNYRYKTELGYQGILNKGQLEGALVIKGSGDPTLGSWRWKQTSEDSVILRMQYAVKSSGIKSYSILYSDTTGWNDETIPGGWVWEDIGNYYGAGALSMNWRENQYDLILKSGNRIGDPVQIVGTKPELNNYPIISFVTAAAKGTGDNTIIYFPVNGSSGIVRGTIPVDESHFVVSGALPSGSGQFLNTLKNALAAKGIMQLSGIKIGVEQISKKPFFPLYSEQSPPLDSIIYWFLKKSINLYGEALAKTIAHEKGMEATTENGVELIKKFWKSKGIEETELNMHDGSGLSPLNRVTTRAQVKVLQYAQSQPWFDGFYLALPEYNGIKMKSGTISSVKGFCGYQKSKDRHQYIFSFLVNNYNGSSSAIVQKMYRVLNELK